MERLSGCAGVLELMRLCASLFLDLEYIVAMVMAKTLAADEASKSLFEVPSFTTRDNADLTLSRLRDSVSNMKDASKVDAF